MKTFLLVIVVACIAPNLIAQETEYPEVFETDSTWFKEVIPFPIHFAPEIKYEGYEDLRFMPGWAKKDSAEFWSYLFAWNVKTDGRPTKKVLEAYIAYYFNGIMRLVNKEKNFVVPDSKVTLSEASNPNMNYQGHVTVHDSFHTKELITLNILSNYKFCKENGRSLIIVRLSPQPLESAVWKSMLAIKPIASLCE